MTQKTTLLPEVHIIAAMLDYPSIYMGGPSARSIDKAVRIIAALGAAGFQVREANDERHQS